MRKILISVKPGSFLMKLSWTRKIISTFYEISDFPKKSTLITKSFWFPKIRKPPIAFTKRAKSDLRYSIYAVITLETLIYRSQSAYCRDIKNKNFQPCAPIEGPPRHPTWDWFSPHLTFVCTLISFTLENIKIAQMNGQYRL